MRYGFYLPTRGQTATPEALETLATIDVLSHGRVTVGVGVGWLREEFQALGAPDFDRRGAVSDEYIRIMTRTGERRPFSGSPGEVESDIVTFARLGVSEIVFDFRGERLEGSLERMERFAPVIRDTARV